MAKRVSPKAQSESKLRTRTGQWTCLVAGAAAVLLGACTDNRPAVGRIGAVEGFLGGVATDEPRATVVAEDVLSAGGTAVDAAIAAFFTLTVTYPVGAGLGGGGTCVVFDPKTNAAQTMEFLAGRPAAGGAFAVPGAVRGLATLHARYGRLNWSSLVAPAEQMARFGHPISRALAKRLVASAAKIAQDSVLTELFHSNGSLKQEGDTLIQIALATTLSQIRARGAGDLYGGPSGRTFVAAARAHGAAITMADLRSYKPVWRETRTLKFGDEVGHVALPPPAGGAVLHDLLQTLRPADARRDNARILEATAKAYAANPGDPMRQTGDASVVVGDREGAVVACSFSIGPPFGAGRVAREAGIILTPVENRENSFSAPMVVANQNVTQGFLAIAASGGWGGPTATALVALALLEDGAELSSAIAAPRLARLSPERPFVYEEGADLSSLPEAGQMVPAIGRVYVVWCASGFARAPQTCRFAADGRGYGLARGQVY